MALVIKDRVKETTTTTGTTTGTTGVVGKVVAKEGHVLGTMLVADSSPSLVASPT